MSVAGVTSDKSKPPALSQAGTQYARIIDALDITLPELGKLIEGQERQHANLAR